MDLSRSIISFKAGRALRREGTNWVDPSPTKGLVSVAPGDDGLLHFYWINRTNNNVEEDLILFPGDASFVPVTEAQGGRTYVLKFTSSDQRLFFWLQDLDGVRDQENVTKLNRALNESFAEDDVAMDAAPPSTSEPASVPPLVPVPDTAGPSSIGNLNLPPGTTPEQLAQLRALLQSMGARGSGAGARRAAFTEPDLSLSDVLTPTNLQPLLDNPTLLSAVFPSLPSDLPVKPSPETIRKIVESPPFQASVRQLDQALATGLLQELMVNLGLPPEAGTGVGPFLKAISDQAKKQRKPEGGDGMDTG